MVSKTNAKWYREIGGKPWLIGLSVVVLIILVAAGFFFWLSTKPQPVVLFFLSIIPLVLLGVAYTMWRYEQFLTVRWWLLNHVIPMVFIFLPPLFGLLVLGQGIDCDAGDDGGISKLFSPAYYSLMVVVSFIFIVLLFELQDYIGRTSEEEITPTKMNQLHSFSALCLLGALAAALLYALPYALDLTCQLSENRKLALFITAAMVAVFAPFGAAWMHKQLMEIKAKPASIHDGKY